MKIKELLENSSININEKYLVLSDILNLSVPEIKLNKDKILTKKELLTYKKIEKKIKTKVPVQYALKKAYFCGTCFYVNKNVLIPRPETEYLVEQADNLIKKIFNEKKIKILDIGTGSGVIGITLNKLNKNSEVIATDISNGALKVAKKNNCINKTKVKYIKTNLYEKVNEKFDVVISNPPYLDVKSNKIEEKVRKNEPQIALFAEDEGLYYYKEILKNIDKILKRTHIVAFEIGENQGLKIKKIIKSILPQDQVIIKKDYNGYDRYIFIISKM